MSRQSALALALALIALIGCPPAGRAQEELARSLSRLPQVFGEAEFHQRKGKEDLFALARRFGVSASAIHNANRGDLLEGDELLRIPTEYVAPTIFSDGLVVNLTERRLFLYQQGRPVRAFPIAIGRRGWETPTGEFTIVNKAKNPTWFPPSWALEETPVPPGPGNPRGDRWMGLSIKGYGIHATNAPSSVGLYVSHGCMRMYPEHARDLYDLVKAGAPVLIVYRRVTLGYREDPGIVYLAHHPDPYEMGDVKPDDVRDMLREYGLDQVVDMAAVEEALARPSSLPTPIAGSAIRVLVNGQPLNFALGPTRGDGDWLVPAGPLVKALRAQIEFGPERSYWIVKRGGERLFYSPCCVEAIVNGQMVQLQAAPQLASGYPLIPLKATVTLLGGSVGWDEERQTILVWDNLGLLSGP